ncbi:MAG: energy-coupling factor transporter transmembrane protein EcfT [Elusimicrobia bacterium]|nr:energy-coupling factor transporter transmembrane protein EcfT [Elusimicrobiota bacterium]
MSSPRGLSGLFRSRESSPVRFLSVETKMFHLASVIILSFVVRSAGCLFLLFLSTFAYSFFARSLRAHFFIVKRMIFFAAVSVALLAVVIREPAYLAGTAVRILARVFIMSSAGILFAATTSPTELIRALDTLRAPKTLIFPITVAVRFIPAIVRETGEIADSLKLKGISVGFFDFLRHPGIYYRAIFMPLVIRSISISDELAAAAEARCFGSPLKRTFLRRNKVSAGDFIFVSAMTLFLIGLIILDGKIRGVF